MKLGYNEYDERTLTHTDNEGDKLEITVLTDYDYQLLISATNYEDVSPSVGLTVKQARKFVKKLTKLLDEADAEVVE